MKVIQGWKAMTQHLSEEILECDSVDHAVPLNSILIYLLEGLLPLLSAFCKQLGSHSSAWSVLTQPIIKTLKKVGTNLDVCLYIVHTCTLSSPIYQIFKTYLPHNLLHDATLLNLFVLLSCNCTFLYFVEINSRSATNISFNTHTCCCLDKFF